MTVKPYSLPNLVVTPHYRGQNTPFVEVFPYIYFTSSKKSANIIVDNRGDYQSKQSSAMRRSFLVEYPSHLSVSFNRCCIKRIVLVAFLTIANVLTTENHALALPLSLEEERVLSEEFLKEVRKQFKFVNEDFAVQYVNDLGYYLIRPLESKPFPFQFHIIKNGSLNAFAGPGGHIFVFSGLIEAMERVDEMAAVICHEIAHITARHLARCIEQSKKIGLASLAGVLAGVLIGGKAAGAVMSGSMAAGAQAQLHYSRMDEREADHLGFKYMDAAGIDPSAMIQVLEKIERGHWFGSGKVPAYLLTHPTGPERMANFDMMLSNHTPRPMPEEAARLHRLFPFFRTVISVACMAAHEAEARFRRELEKNPGSAQAHFGLGLVLKERAEYDSAIGHFREALKMDHESTVLLKNLGETYELGGQGQSAIEIYEALLKIDKDDKKTLFLLAQSYQEVEACARAIPLYEKLALLRSVRNEVYYNLGVCYGKEGKLALAHLNFGVYFVRMGEKGKAMFHFQKAEELALKDSDIQDRIRKARETLHLQQR
jgi:predicted Zn-dependent protease